MGEAVRGLNHLYHLLNPRLDFPHLLWKYVPAILPVCCRWVNSKNVVKRGLVFGVSSDNLLLSDFFLRLFLLQ